METSDKLIYEKEYKMKHCNLLLSLLFISMITAALSCGTVQEYSCPDLSGKVDTGSFKDGWCDENTYLLKAAADGNPKISPINKRRAASLELAKFTAQMVFLDRFKDRCKPVDAPTLMYNPEENARTDAVIKHMLAEIKKGVVVYSEYEESGMAVIIYKIYSPGLKRFYDTCGADMYGKPLN